MKKLKYTVLFVAIFLFTTGFSYIEDKQRVFDYSGLLTISEARDAETVLKEQSLEDKVDYAFVSTNNLEGHTAKDYMELFLNTQQMGYDKAGGDSAILLVNLQDNEVWVGTGGTLDEFIQETDISNIVSDILPYTQKNDFEAAIQVFAHNIHTRVEAKNTQSSAQSGRSESDSSALSYGAQSDNQVNNIADNHSQSQEMEQSYDEENDMENKNEREGLFSNPLTCLLIGAVLSGIIVFVMIQSGKSSMRAGADTYTTEARVNPYTKQDIFIRTVTQKIKKEKSKEDRKQ